MTNIHLELYILGIIGLFLHYFKTWADTQKKGGEFSVMKVMPMAFYFR